MLNHGNLFGLQLLCFSLNCQVCCASISSDSFSGSVTGGVETQVSETTVSREILGHFTQIKAESEADDNFH